MKRVKWTAAEEEFVVQTVIEYRREDMRSCLLGLINRAVKKLPEARRRKLLSLQAVPRIVSEVETRWLEEMTAPARVVEKIVLVHDDETKWRMDHLSAKVDQANEYIARVLNRVATTTGVALPEQPRLMLNVRRIAVFGLLEKQQAEMLRMLKPHDLPVRLEFRFHGSAKGQVINPSRYVDMCFLMTKFTSHSQQGNIINTVGRGRLTHVSGGLSDLVLSIVKWANTLDE